MLIKAKGELPKNLTISTKRTSTYGGARTTVWCLIFYGRDMNAVNSWLTTQKHKTVIVEDEVVHRFQGHYEKMAHAHTEQHDPMSFRHAGFGQNAIGAAADQDLAGELFKGGLKLTKALQSRAFIAYVGDRDGEPPGAPKLMHNQTDIKWVNTLKRGPETRMLLNVSSGYLVLTEAAARRVIVDPNARPGDKWAAGMRLHELGQL